MAASKDIKNALVSLLSDVELGGEPAFTAVKGNDAGEFDGYPSVRVLPGDQTTEKASTQQNDRTVSFIIRTHVPEDGDGSEVDLMYDLTDLIIDTLDSADASNVLAAQIGTYILNATRGDWFVTDSNAGSILMCDINVDVSYSKNN